MRQLLIVSGTLGGGTALVFVAAALVAAMFPTGALVPASPWGGDVRFGPAMPAIRGPLVFDDTSGGGVLDRPIPIGGGVQIDPGIDVVVPPVVVSPDEVVH
jgi:hypothetical protein